MMDWPAPILLPWDILLKSVLRRSGFFCDGAWKVDLDDTIAWLVVGEVGLRVGMFL